MLSRTLRAANCAARPFRSVPLLAAVALALGTAPDRSDEYRLYQILLGTWPLSLMDPAAINPETIKGYLERMLRWQETCLQVFMSRL